MDRYSKDEQKAIAHEIVRQLGGSRFMVMTGVKHFTCGERDGQVFVSMKVGRNAKSVTHVKITLTPADLYKVEFLRIRNVKSITKPATIKTVAEVDGVYCDMLQDVFTEHTGLYTRL